MSESNERGEGREVSVGCACPPVPPFAPPPYQQDLELKNQVMLESMQREISELQCAFQTLSAEHDELVRRVERLEHPDLRRDGGKGAEDGESND